MDIRKSSCLLHVKQNTCQNIYLTISLNDVDGIIIGGGVVARPLQFQLGKFITMNGIIEKQDPGWDDIDDKTFFHRSEGYKREYIVMSTTKEYEECFIMYSTMNFIKKLSAQKINKTRARLNVCLRSAVSCKTFKLVMIHFEVGTLICSKMKTLVFVPQMI